MSSHSRPSQDSPPAIGGGIDRLARAVDVVGLKPGRRVRNLTPARQRESVARARAKSFHEGFEETILSRSHGERGVSSLDHEVDLSLRRGPETKSYPVSLERGAVRPFHSAVFRFAAGIDPFQSPLTSIRGPCSSRKRFSAQKRATARPLAQRAGVPVRYLLFEGEQHGFRRAETIKRALDAELYLVLRSGPSILSLTAFLPARLKDFSRLRPRLVPRPRSSRTSTSARRSSSSGLISSRSPKATRVVQDGPRDAALASGFERVEPLDKPGIRRHRQVGSYVPRLRRPEMPPLWGAGGKGN